MRLISFTSIATLLLSLNSFARTETKHTSISVYSTTEEEVVEKAQAAIPTIKYATNKKVLTFGHQNHCTFRRSKYNKDNRIKVYGVTVNKMYKLNKEVLESYYRAKINYVFKSCKSSDND